MLQEVIAIHACVQCCYIDGELNLFSHNNTLPQIHGKRQNADPKSAVHFRGPDPWTALPLVANSGGPHAKFSLWEYMER